MATKAETERLAVLETKMTNIETTVNRIEVKFDNLDSKYAAKWVQTVIGGLIALILISFITALIFVVIPAARNTPAASATPTTTTSPTKSTQTPSTSTTSISNTTNTTPSSGNSGGLLNKLPLVGGN